jgi:hypothetical protein
MLLSTTIKTFQQWIPPAACPITFTSPITGMLRAQLPDRSRVEAEFLFLALDLEEDAVARLKSLELTGAFVNEASEIRYAAIELLTTRVGRYPSPKQGGATWKGIVMDTNPVDDTHWWYRLAEVEKPKGYRFWCQPPGVVRMPGKSDKDPPLYVPNDGTLGFPKAENVQNLPDGFDYYMRAVQGKSEEWIKVFLMGQYGSVFSGKAVYAEYSDKLHVAEKPLEPYRGLPLILGFDFGLTPSCAIIQQTPRGQVRILAERTSSDMGIERFLDDIIRPLLQLKYDGMKIYCVGDPAGGQRSQTNEITVFQQMEAQGFRCEPAATNDFQMRRDAVAWFLGKLVDGNPGFIMDPECKTLRAGFLGKYHYRKFKTESEKYAETPDKNEYSHLHDALQYACLYVRTVSVAGTRDNFFRPKLRQIVPGNAAAWT